MDLWNMICRRHLLKLVPLNVPGNLDMVIAKMQSCTELYTVITKNTFYTPKIISS